MNISSFTPDKQVKFQYWLDVIRQRRASRLTNHVWCEQHNVFLKSYYSTSTTGLLKYVSLLGTIPVILLIGAIISSILFLFKQTLTSFIPIALSILSLIVFFIIDSQKRNLELMLKEHYTPYSKKRMNMTIDILKKYDINIEKTTQVFLSLYLSLRRSVMLLHKMKETIKNFV